LPGLLLDHLAERPQLVPGRGGGGIRGGLRGN
jgi:hypothetical protein